VNYARSLKGVQIGAVNISGRGGLPVSPVLNFSF